MTREIPDRAVNFIAEFEGCELTAYQDIVGVWTIGYGHTGADVTPGLKITKTKAKTLLKQDLAVAAARIAARVKGEIVYELSDDQYSALLSFVYNLGANPSWTIWKVLNKRQFDQVPMQMMKFVNAGGKKVRGLVRRRTAECELWNSDAEDVRIVARLVDTPPTDGSRKPLAESKTIWSASGSAVIAASAGINEVQEALAPTAGSSDYFDRVLMIMMFVSVVLALGVIIFRWLDHKREQN